MSLTVSHHDLDLDRLEQLSSGAHSVAKSVVADCDAVTGAVVLATCNRFEVYLEVDAGAPDVAAARDAAAEATTAVVSTTSGLPVADVAAALRRLHGPRVPQHLFAVASGLDSMVVGEREVAGQVRRALQTARADATTSTGLERLFQSASRASRHVAARTGLGAAGQSVVGVALDLATERLGDLHGLRTLLIGTGSYAQGSLVELRTRGAVDIAVHSPSGRAEKFAVSTGARAVRAEDLTTELATAELVVSCSGAAGPVLDAEMVRLARRSGAAGERPRPCVVVDLALRHDVAREVGDIDGVELIDLSVVQEHAPNGDAASAGEAVRIVAEHATEFEATLEERTLTPAVVALRRHVDDLLQHELARARARDAESAEHLERSLRRFAASMLHGPTTRAREHARAGEQEAYLAGLRAVFGIDPHGDDES